jgi:hypothetical protein
MWNSEIKNQLRELRWQLSDLKCRLESLENFNNSIFVKTENKNKHIEKKCFYGDE